MLPDNSAAVVEVLPRNTELLLKESEVRFRRLFETAQDGILLLNADNGEITEVNQFLLDLLGYSHAEIVGKKLWELGFFKDIEAAKAAYVALQSTGYVRYDDLPLETKAGCNMDVEFISNVYLVGTERVIQCNIRDVSERKKLEQLKDNFLSTISHEIRTPLSILKMGIDNLAKSGAGKFDQDETDTMEALKRNVDRLARLINDVLDLSRFESGKVGPKMHLVYLDVLIQEVIQGFRSAATDRGVEIKVDCPENLPGLLADPDLLVRVMTNLLDNAVRFAKSVIIIEVKKVDSSMQISVSDDGPGISPDHLPTLFDKFIQVDRPLGGSGYKGTGLGLAICSEIIKLHNGKLWAERIPGSGSKFTFSIACQNREKS